jgi:hypothetical protein
MERLEEKVVLEPEPEFFKNPTSKNISSFINQMESIGFNELENDWIRQHKESVMVYIFEYTGPHCSQSNSDIRNFGRYECQRKGIEYKTILTEDKYFTKVHGAVLLKDNLMEMMVWGFFEVKSYLDLITDPHFQKFNIIPFMANKYFPNNIARWKNEKRFLDSERH